MRVVAVAGERQRAVEAQRSYAAPQVESVRLLQTEERATHDEKVHVRAQPRHPCRGLNKHVDALPALEARHHDNQRRPVRNTELGAELVGPWCRRRGDESIPNDSH